MLAVGPAPQWIERPREVLERIAEVAHLPVENRADAAFGVEEQRPRDRLARSVDSGVGLVLGRTIRFDETRFGIAPQDQALFSLLTTFDEPRRRPIRLARGSSVDPLDSVDGHVRRVRPAV